MAVPSLYPLFMINPFGAGAGGGDGFIVELVADPDITLDPDIQLTLEPGSIDIEVEPDIEIEVE